MKSVSIIIISVMFLCGNAAAQDGDADYSALTAENHPRLIFNDSSFDRLKAMLEDSEEGTVDRLHDHMMSVADSYGLDEEPLEFRLDASGKRLLPVSRKALSRIVSCAYAYRMTGEKAYLKHAERDLNAVCSFESWNPRHFLDVAEMAAGVAIGYDWLHDDLKKKTKARIVRVLDEYAMQAAGNKSHAWFYKRVGNWNQVCNSGLVCAALATYEHHPETARRIIEDAVTSNMKAVKGIYGPDGAYPEGPTYWGFGTLYQVLMLTVMEDCLGTEFGLSAAPGFLETGTFKTFSRGCTGKHFNFADNSSGCGANYPLWYFASETGNPSLLYDEVKLLGTEKYETPDHRGLMPLALRYAMEMPQNEIPEPSECTYAGRGKTPMFMCRTGWKKKDLYLGIKGGTDSYLHGHMDAGTFVFDAYGVRWAMDYNRQPYASVENGIKELGGRLADMEQNSLRWRLFRLNCRQHNTLTVNGADHDVEAFVPMTATFTSGERMGASFDLTDLFWGDVASAVRTAAIVDGEYLEVKDEVEAFGDAPVRLRWTMVTEAVPEVTQEGILLTKNGITMLLSTSGAEVNYRTWSSDPQDYDSVLKHLDAPNEGTYICGYEVEIPAGEAVPLVTTLKRK